MKIEKTNYTIADCDRVVVQSNQDLEDFSCGDDDLDEFFKSDAILYDKQLLGKTYYFQTKDTGRVLGAVTVSNDSIKASLISNSIRNRLQRKIPNAKRTRNYPAILIGRLGVSKEVRGSNIGSQIIDYIKYWFTRTSNKSGCRFVVVEAYNHPKILNFYEKNEFKYLYNSEEDEKNTLGLDAAHLNTRIMYFDLIRYADSY